MPNPNRHEQPAGGGLEIVEAALQKQSELKGLKKPVPGTETGKQAKSGKPRRQDP